MKKELEELISIIAAMNGKRISSQTIEIIATNHGLSREDIIQINKYCEANEIAVSDELESLIEEDEIEEEDIPEEDIIFIAIEDYNEIRSDKEKLSLDQQYSPLDSRQCLIKKMLNNVEGSISQRNKEVIEFCYGINDGIPHSIEETAKEFGVTTEMIRLKVNLFYRKSGMGCRPRKWWIQENLLD